LLEEQKKNCLSPEETHSQEEEVKNRSLGTKPDKKRGDLALL
jgi:hypothetical protein